jgi:hypothetical protein
MSLVGTKRTNRVGLVMSVDKGKTRSGWPVAKNDAFDPTETWA